MGFSSQSRFTSHLLYADDVLLFVAATKRNVRAISHIFDEYEAISGQQVSWDKSGVVFGSHVSGQRRASLVNMLHLKKLVLPFNYLGVPLFKGAPKRKWLQPLADKITSKFASWKGHSLSLAGRITLVNSVIQSSFLHSFAVYAWPKSLLLKMEKAIRNFVWTGSVDKRKLIMPPWKDCCLFICEGGIGLKNLSCLNKALLAKICWSINKSDCFPLNLLKSRLLDKSGTLRSCFFPSSIRSSIKEIYDVIVYSSRWLICKSSTRSFWHDKWIDPPIAQQINIPPADRGNLNQLVSDCYSSDSWILPSAVPMHVREKIEKTEFLHGDVDECVWIHSTNGIFTVKSAYNYFLSNHNLVPPWQKFLWKEFLPPTRSITCWRAFLGFLPTEDLLIRKGFSMASICRFCKRHEETSTHLFVSCPFAHEVWNAVAAVFNTPIDTSGVLDGLLQDAATRNFSSQVGALWNVAIVSSVWIIWHKRNKIIFYGEDPDIAGTLRHLWRCIKETELFNIGTAHTMDDLRVLKMFNIHLRQRKKPMICSVFWHFPPPSWLKCNTDGASLGAPGVAGAGGIFRTYRGFPHGSFAFNIETGYAYEAELLAAIFAIEKFKDLCWDSLWLESDSTYVVQLLKSRSSDVPWKFKTRWSNCLHIIASINFHVSHVFREGNSVADCLASFGVKNDGLHWWPSHPSFIDHLVSSDSSCKEYFRIR